MHELHPRLLWIGHTLDVSNPRRLFDVGITAIIDLAYEEPPAQISRQFTYCRFPLNDGGGNSPNTLLLALRTTADLLRTDTRTLIACSAGMSRSPTIAAFALAYHLSEQPEVVIARIADSISLELKPALWADTLNAFENLKSTSKSESDA